MSGLSRTVPNYCHGFRHRLYVDMSKSMLNLATLTSREPAIFPLFDTNAHCSILRRGFLGHFVVHAVDVLEYILHDSRIILQASMFLLAFFECVVLDCVAKVGGSV